MTNSLPSKTDVYIRWLAFWVVGCAATCIQYGMVPVLYSDLSQSATTYQRTIIFAALMHQCALPITILSDTVPLCGWYRRWYIVAALCTFCCTVGVIIGAYDSNVVYMGYGVSVLAVVWVKTLVENYMLHLIQNKFMLPRTMPEMWTLVHLGVAVASIIVLGNNQVHSHSGGLFGFVLAITLVTAIPLLKRDTLPLDQHRSNLGNQDIRLLDADQTVPGANALNPPAVGMRAKKLAFVAFGLAVLTAGVILQHRTWPLFVLIAFMAGCTLYYAASAERYLFLYSSTNVTIWPLVVLFMTSDTCNGPHIPLVTYFTVTAMASCCLVLIGIVYIFKTHQSTEHICIVLIIARCIGTLVDIAMFKQWTLSRASMMASSAVLHTAVDTLMFYIIAKSEYGAFQQNLANRYQQLSSCRSIGVTLSMVIGLALMQQSKIDVSLGNCAVFNLGPLIFFAGAVMPLYALVWVN